MSPHTPCDFSGPVRGNAELHALRWGAPVRFRRSPHRAVGLAVWWVLCQSDGAFFLLSSCHCLHPPNPRLHLYHPSLLLWPDVGSNSPHNYGANRVPQRSDLSWGAAPQASSGWGTTAGTATMCFRRARCLSAMTPPSSAAPPTARRAPAPCIRTLALHSSAAHCVQQRRAAPTHPFTAGVVAGQAQASGLPAPFACTPPLGAAKVWKHYAVLVSSACQFCCNSVPYPICCRHACPHPAPPDLARGGWGSCAVEGTPVPRRRGRRRRR